MPSQLNQGRSDVGQDFCGDNIFEVGPLSSTEELEHIFKMELKYAVRNELFRITFSVVI
jgi:hypothetical protein